MKLGIFSKTFQRPTIEQVFADIAFLGLEAVQFNWESAGLPEMPDELADDLCDRIRAGAKDCGLELAAVSGTFNIIHLEERPDGMRRLRVLAAACQRLDTRLITFCTGTRDPDYLWRYHPDNGTPEAWRDMLDAVEEAVRIAEEYGVTLVFEPEVNNIVDSASKARRLLDEIRSEHLKVVIDAANLFHKGELPRMREILDEAFDLLGSDIRLAHGKDLERDGDAGHQAAGTGLLDYGHYLSCLNDTGFTGALILHSLSEAQAPGSLAFVRSRLISV